MNALPFGTISVQGRSGVVTLTDLFAAINSSGNVVGTIQIYSDIAANLATKVGAVGQPLLATDSGQFSIGDGGTAFGNLSWLSVENHTISTSTAQAILPSPSNSEWCRYFVSSALSTSCTVFLPTPNHVGQRITIHLMRGTLVNGFFIHATDGLIYQNISVLPLSVTSPGILYPVTVIDYFGVSGSNFPVVSATNMTPLDFSNWGVVSTPLPIKSVNVGGNTTATAPLNVKSIPISSAGLSSGDIWCDTTAANVLKIV